jgi:hypothetical protein
MNMHNNKPILLLNPIVKFPNLALNNLETAKVVELKR